MNTKLLQVGDKLYSEGSWNIIEVTIISINGEIALSDKGHKFCRYFQNGDDYIYPKNGFSIDFHNWYLTEA